MMPSLRVCCLLATLSGENVSHAFVTPTVAGCVDLVVQMELVGSGQRRVREVVGVTGRVEGDVVATTELFVTRGDRLVRADGYPPHAERFERAGYDLRALLAPAAVTRTAG